MAFFEDLRFALRQLSKAPGFALITLITLRSVLSEYSDLQRDSCGPDASVGVDAPSAWHHAHEQPTRT